MTVAAAVFGCAGPVLTDWERGFFAETDPLGFILFARNCVSPDQVRGLVSSLRAAVGRAEAPVLIDQEGGRVARLKPPVWRAAPPAARFGALAQNDPERACEAARLNARLLALELRALDIGVDCLPLLDLRRPEGHGAIGDRAFCEDPELVAALGRAVCEGLLAAGVLPVIKHLPGQGRATIDSHAAPPRVATPRAELEASDFLPFRRLSDAPWGMTGHVVYEAIDPERPATTSPAVIAEVIRGHIGFEGLLLTDDLSMQALSGSLEARARAALEAGCDLALHCNGVPEEMMQVARALRPLSAAAQARLKHGAKSVGEVTDMEEFSVLAQRLETLLAA